MSQGKTIGQLNLFGKQKGGKKDLSSTFVNNMSLPVHRWFRYSAGFSAQWVRSLISSEGNQGRDRIIDPFAGSGTVLLESDFQGLTSFGVDAHPFVYRVAKAKLNWKTDPEPFRAYCKEIVAKAKERPRSALSYPSLISKCYSEESLQKLDALKSAWIATDGPLPVKELSWLLITGILRATAQVGTAQWQYVLPNKTKSNPSDPIEAFQAKTQDFIRDMLITQQTAKPGGNSTILLEDTRDIQSIPEEWGNLVITSPPYANNYDYADATRLEMTFWGEVESWGDLHDAVRKYLIRACTQHVSRQKSFKKAAEDLLKSDKIATIEKELTPIFNELAKERLTKGGKKDYHLMILGYFLDLSDCFRSLRRVTQKGETLMCFVIGDSAPYGVYVPVDKWLGELAIAAGFESYEFEKLRDRNIKWKNRKHQVPLKEGRLWIKG